MNYPWSMTNDLRPAKIISTCVSKDLETWRYCHKNILKYVEAGCYELVVPDAQVEHFRAVTHESYDVLPESRYIGQRSLEWFAKRDAGWYLQQFIKIEALRSGHPDEVNVIWDADTMPIRNIRFIDEDGALLYRVGSEHHKPYFLQLKILLGLPRILNASFIAQCFPSKVSWAQSFCAEIEKRHGCLWMDAILKTIDQRQKSGFSEYESLGTYNLANHPDQVRFLKNGWERYGNSFFGGPDRITGAKAWILSKVYDYISFESWDIPKKKDPIHELGTLARLVWSRRIQGRDTSIPASSI